MAFGRKASNCAHRYQTNPPLPQKKPSEAGPWTNLLNKNQGEFPHKRLTSDQNRNQNVGEACLIFRLIIFTVLAVVAMFACHIPPVMARSDDLAKYMAKVPAGEIFDNADSYGPTMSDKPIAPILQDGKKVGYVFLNTGFSSAIGYSGKPIIIIIGLDLAGRITGAKLVHHTEPIVLAGIPEKKITDFIDGYKSLNIPEIATVGSNDLPPVDIVSGATVTVLIIDDSIRRASIRAARALGLGGLTAKITNRPTVKKSIKKSYNEIHDWLTLTGDGTVRRLKLNVSEVNEAFKKTGNAIAIERPEPGYSEETYIDLYIASLSVPGVAKSLIGEAEYKNLKKRLKPGQDAFLIMGSGRYSFVGSGFVRGGIFDRITVVQGENTLRFRDRGYKNLGELAAKGAPHFTDIGIFMSPKGVEFDPVEPWHLQLLLYRAIGALNKVFVNYDLNYQLPAKYINIEKLPQPTKAAGGVGAASGAFSGELSDDKSALTALWQRIWKQKMGKVIVLSLAIILLTIVFFFQDFLVVNSRLTDRVRIGFLIFTLFWIGFYAQAQLSVVNVLVFVNALLGDFSWEFFLMEPLIFILWCSVAASILFWGRGAYCGWLCPFGALQELLSKLAKWKNIPQYVVPWALHERLWPIKYLIFLALLGLSVYSLALAEHYAEIEPFKTAIVLRFARSWPYLLFVGALLGAGLFIERFYCRYLCPLGAALAIPARISMFHWLKRYRNCGDPCHRCAQDCMVQAIDPMGEINPNECLHCLNCQQMYYNEEVCPVVIQKLAKARKAKPEGENIAKIEEAKTLVRRPRRLGRARSIEE